jgi:hypothetical protein
MGGPATATRPHPTGAAEGVHRDVGRGVGCGINKEMNMVNDILKALVEKKEVKK